MEITKRLAIWCESDHPFEVAVCDTKREGKTYSSGSESGIDFGVKSFKSNALPVAHGVVPNRVHPGYGAPIGYPLA